MSIAPNKDTSKNDISAYIAQPTSSPPSYNNTGQISAVDSPNSIFGTFDIKQSPQNSYQPMDIDPNPYLPLFHQTNSAPPSTFEGLSPSAFIPLLQPDKEANPQEHPQKDHLHPLLKFTPEEIQTLPCWTSSNPIQVSRYTYPPTDLPAVPLRGMSPFAAPNSKRQALTNRGYEYLEEELEPRLAKSEAMIRELLRLRGEDTLRRVSVESLSHSSYSQDEYEDDRMMVDQPPAFSSRHRGGRGRGR
ncbi:hypothetical protein BT69DRAFT_1335553 [Atractiella rhizophila]|nr:hypothetical protein BT69DRAFT_1335553 [Atractiella rhizophila]